MLKIKFRLWIFYLLLTFNQAFGGNYYSEIFSESVDLIELNHFYDEHGRLVFDQVIFFDWNEEHLESRNRFGDSPRYNVRAWRLIRTPNQLPIRNPEDKLYYTFWTDGEQMRRIISKSIVETWTQWDVELLEREHLPKEKRRELKTVKIKKK